MPSARRQRIRRLGILSRAGLALILCLSPLTACIFSSASRGIHQRTDSAAPWRITAGLAQSDQTAVSPEHPLRLYAPVNGIAAVQLVLTADHGPTAGLDIVADDLTMSDSDQSVPGDSPAAKRIPRDTIRIFRPSPVRVERFPNWYLKSQGLRQSRDVPDALIPFDSAPDDQSLAARARSSKVESSITLLVGQQLALWIEIHIPHDASPGAYRSSLLVRDGHGDSQRVLLEVVVLDVMISSSAVPVSPPQPTSASQPTEPELQPASKMDTALNILARVQLRPILTALADAGPAHAEPRITSVTLAMLEDPTARRAVVDAFALLHAHGLSPYTNELHPPFTQNTDGSVRVDWSQYDSFCGPLIDGSAYRDHRPAAAWPLPADLTQPEPAQYDGLASTAYAAVLKDYLTQVRTHFQEKGWLARSFLRFDLPANADAAPEEFEQIRRLAEVSHAVDPSLAFVSAIIPQSMTPFGWVGHRFTDLSGSVDIYATPARYEHPATLDRLRAAGKRTWFVPDWPPFSGSLAVEAPATQARSLPWQAFLHHHDAISLSQTTDWPARVFENSIADRGQASDAWLIYPGSFFGRSRPIPSLRLKQLALGLQDYQLLRLLDDHGRGETARLLAGSLIKAAAADAYGDNYQDGLFDRRTDDPAVWGLAASLLLQEAADAVNETAAPAFDRAANQSAWAKFLAATRRIILRPESARLRPLEPGNDRGFGVTYEVTIRNELRTPLRGELQFAIPNSPVMHVGPLREMELARATIMKDWTPFNLDGHLRDRLIFDAGPSGRAEADALVSVVRADKAPRPITIDGRLDDWPPASLNIAADFRLTAAPAPDPTTPGLAPRALSQTMAYFCSDAGRLCIAVHAQCPPGAAPPAAPESNLIEYEDLMPIGPDLAEILIDPTNSATQSGDLYHLVIKATGNPLFERGIAMHPSIGATAPWPGRQPDYAVLRTDDGWTAEIAIDLACFGPDAARNSIWGINIARLEPQRGEYSNWSAAPRYCYDPRTLGNLIWSP